MKRSSRHHDRPSQPEVRPIAAWREIESALVEYFRAEGGQIVDDSGESYLIVSVSQRQSEQADISLSDLARKLTDPTSCPRL